jgi:hypothetical protein
MWIGLQKVTVVKASHVTVGSVDGASRHSIVNKFGQHYGITLFWNAMFWNALFMIFMIMLGSSTRRKLMRPRNKYTMVDGQSKGAVQGSIDYGLPPTK